MKIAYFYKGIKTAMKLAPLALIMLLIASCASLPTPEQAATADYGSYPNNYEDIVKDYFAKTLKDPDSVKYQSISTPKKFWLGDKFTGARFGYLVCVTLNAKNSYGGYVGYQTDGLLIRNGLIVEYIDKGDWWGRQICQ